MDIRKHISPYEEKVYKLTRPIGDLSYYYKRKFSSHRFYTVEFLLKLCGFNMEDFSNNVKELLPRKITQLSQSGSRMSSNCMVVQFDEDHDDVIRWAFANGAIIAVTRTQIDDYPCVVVDDPEEVYTKICTYIRNLNQVEVTVVAGSIGKTSTKKMVDSVYSTHFKTFNDPENENQLPCIGYAIQHIPTGTQQQVQELSEDIPGCLDKMMRILSPKIAIITAIDRSHIESFGSEKAVYDEVATVIEKMPADGIVIINLDDKVITQYVQKCKTITISMDNSEADYYARNIKLTKKGLAFNIIERSSTNSFHIQLNRVYARHNVYTALYAFAAGRQAGVPYKKCIKGIERFKMVGIRQNVYNDIWNKNIIYADCYNAVAKSVISAIETASAIPVEGRRIAVLGDVEEAGDFSVQTHCDIVKCVNSSNFDILIAYGDKLCNAISSNSQIRESLTIYKTSQKSDIVSLLRVSLQRGDLVLFKSSRKSALETIIKGVWGTTYRLQMIKYYWAVIKWRLKVLLN